MIDLGTGNNNKVCAAPARALHACALLFHTDVGIAGLPSGLPSHITADSVFVFLLQINWAMNDKQEFIDIVEVVYRGARKGRGLVVSPKGDAFPLLS